MIPLKIFEEIVEASGELGWLVNKTKIIRTENQAERIKELRYRLNDIERAYTFDSDQEEQMV